MPRFILLLATAVVLMAGASGCGADSTATGDTGDKRRADSLRCRADSLVEAAHEAEPDCYRGYFGEALDLRRRAAILSPDTADKAEIEYLESRIQMIDTLYYYQSKL